MKTRKKLLAVVGVLAMLSALLVPAAVLAEDDTIATTEVLSGGTASALDTTPATSLTLTPLTITGEDLSTSDDQPGAFWILTDDSGDGLGWQVQIKAANVTFANNSTRAAADDLTLDSSLAADKWTLTTVVSRTDATTLDLITDATSSPKSELYGTSAGGADVVGSATNIAATDIVLVKAPDDAGMGSYDIKPKFCLGLPASAYSGAYTVDLTLTTTFTD